MIEIKCPRCEQYWYDDDDAEGGNVRLCSRCVDQLRLERGHRAAIDMPFLIGVGVFLVFDLIMIALTALMPEAMGKATLVVGLVLCAVGGVSLKMFQSGDLLLADRLVNTDWMSGRWALLMLLSGFTLMGFSLARIAR
jgi:hypothetical protein